MDRTMSLAEALEGWLGALEAGGPLQSRQKQTRAIFLGAGFTKATFGGAPLFGDYKKTLRELLLNRPTLPKWLHDVLEKDRKLEAEDWRLQTSEVTDLIEILHDLEGRRAVIEALLIDPAPGSFALEPEAYRPFRRPLPPRMDGVYRTLEQWQETVRSSSPTHLSALHPAKPVVMLGRLVAERAVHQVLSTNWDAYVELGCWLTGQTVLCAEEERTAPIEPGHPILERFDSPRDVALHPRREDAVPLLKLHGGVDNVCRVLEQAATGRLTPAQAQTQLAESFLVATSDLTHWRDASQWVQDAVSATLRSSRVLFLGVSGADPVTFRAVRARVAEWERRHLESEGEQRWRQSPSEGDRRPVAHDAPLAAVDYGPGARLACMMSVRRPRGTPAIQAVQCGGDFALRAAYGWQLLHRVLAALEPRKAELGWLSDTLEQRFRGELMGKDDKNAPLLSLLCDALGPSARWAALAEGRPPFEVPTFQEESLWWYVPWGGEPDGHPFGRPTEGHPVVQRASLVQIAACAEMLSRGPGGEGPALKVDPWTGAVHVLPNHPEAWLGERTLLLLPWPWPYQNGLEASSLRTALRTWSRRIPGRSLSALGSPRTWIVPVLDPEAHALTTHMKARSELPLGAGWKRMALADWREGRWLEP